MADKTTSALTAAGTLDGTEKAAIVKGANSRRTTSKEIGDLGPFFNVQAYGWLPDSTDRSTQALALLTAVSVAGGGTIYFPPATGTYRADSQLLIPNDAASPQPKQVNIRLTGAGGGAAWNANPGFALSPNATIVDLRYLGLGGKIESLGLGSLVIENLEIKDGGASNGTPLIHSSNTVLTVRQNTFVGSGAKTATVTMTIASPAVVSWTGHLLQPNAAIKFTNSGGALPTGVTANQLYYVSATGLTADAFQFSVNSGGPSVNTSGSQSGTHTGRFGGQDAIVLGGIGNTANGAVDGPFQGYGTSIANNAFTNLNRGVYGLNWANDVKVLFNSFVHNTGTVAIESDGSAGFAASQLNTGWTVFGNTIEMDVYTYGVKLVATRYSTLGPNGFYDGVSGIPYRLEASVANPSYTSTLNTIIRGYDNATTFITQTGSLAQLTLCTIIGAFPGTTASTGATAVLSTEIASGLVIKGKYLVANQYPGQLTVIDSADGVRQFSMGYDASVNTGYLDAYNLTNAVPNPIKINSRGGAVQTGAQLRLTKTADYTVTIADSSTQFDNNGAAGQITFTLPAIPTVSGIAGGVLYGFAVLTAQNLKVLVGHAAATINNGGTVSAAGGFMISNTVGSYMVLEQVDTANGRIWFVKSLTGTWTVT